MDAGTCALIAAGVAAQGVVDELAGAKYLVSRKQRRISELDYWRQRRGGDQSYLLSGASGVVMGGRWADRIDLGQPSGLSTSETRVPSSPLLWTVSVPGVLFGQRGWQAFDYSKNLDGRSCAGLIDCGPADSGATHFMNHGKLGLYGY